jgi:lipopolysaccharide export system permease protein
MGPFIATFFISVFVLLMQFLWKWIEDLVGKGLDFMVIAELMYYASVSLIPMALPLAILLASIMTYGNLGEKFELTAIKAAGISLQRAMLPLTIFTLITSLGAFFIANNVIPYANLKMSALIWSIRNQRPELNIKPSIFNNDIEDFSIRISRKDEKTGMMYDFVVYDHTKGKANNVCIVQIRAVCALLTTDAI